MKQAEKITKFTTIWLLAGVMTAAALSGCGSAKSASSGNAAKDTGKKASIGLSELEALVSEAEQSADSVQLRVKGELAAEANMNGDKNSVDGNLTISAGFEKASACFSGEGKVAYTVKTGANTISGNKDMEIFGEKAQDQLEIAVNADDRKWYTDTMSVTGYQYLYDWVLASASGWSVSGMDESYDELENTLYHVNDADCYVIKKTVNEDNAEDYFAGKSFLNYLQELDLKTVVYIDEETFLPVRYELDMKCNLTNEKQYADIRKLSLAIDIVQGKAEVKDAPADQKDAERVDMGLDSLVEEIQDNEEMIGQYVSSLTFETLVSEFFAPNMTGTVEESKRRRDKAAAEEIAAQLQTSIADYETGYGDLITANGSGLTITWSDTDVTCSNEVFLAIIRIAIGSNVQSKVDPSKYAVATISLKDPAQGAAGGYVVTVTLNNETATVD